jgi:hypothetical protein
MKNTCCRLQNRLNKQALSSTAKAGIGVAPNDRERGPIPFVFDSKRLFKRRRQEDSGPNFEFPERRFSHVVHAATEASARLNDESPLLMFDTIVQGKRRTLDFAVQ